jgi:uncharacterized protein (DUF488 family)
MKIFTIGFTKKSAEDFFSRLKKHPISRVVDVRLNNVSQLAGFAKREDLQYFLREICGIEYMHLPILAPTQEMLDRYRKVEKSWAAYEAAFLGLMKEREIEMSVSRELLDSRCLLCSEDTPEHCHRRLVAEYLKEKWGEVEIQHL